MSNMTVEGGFKLTADGKMYKKGKRIYPNKDEYEGEFVENLKHGNGVLRYANNNKYTGEFKDDFPHGFGVYQYHTIDDKGRRVKYHKYEGNFQRGKRHGKGVYIAANGDTYTGEFENDLYHGEGLLVKVNGDRFEGDWERGKASGKTIDISFGNGDKYNGGMRNGLFNGKGEFLWRRNTGSYKGEWWKGKAHGRGERIFINGNKFTGSFSAGRMQGDGIMSYTNGDQYIGEWRSGHKHGKGVLRFANGDRYEGGFYSGIFYGYGKFTYSDGSYYEGEYLVLKKGADDAVGFPDPNGLRNGSGLRVWANGNRYEGSFRDDFVHGDGSLQKFEGGKYSGEFRNGERHGMGIEEFGNLIAENYVCPMGNKHKGEGYCIYNGQFANNKFDGIGEFMCQDNRYYKGHWKGGKRHGRGVQSYLREGEAGDAKRLFIGGVGSLYRFRLFDGMWQNDVREGHGVATYVNGDTIEGNFISGRAHGIVKYTFASTGAVNHAMYCRGIRESFDSKESAKVLSNMALQFLMDDAAFTNTIASHTGVGNFGEMTRNYSKQPTL
mmetsp:Transcript_25731/g.43349  ORF Transcript_25731/g.43349 Transcript_25731/m.43349 type:complete len:550 (-) Transcript_25731:116-1765(-)